MSENSEPQTDCKHVGRHLSFLNAGGWEYVTRTSGTGVVGIIATTPEGALVLVEQFRKPLSANVLELPAGLVGDVSPESFEQAARRELLEETGYVAETMEDLFVGPSSAGLTDETITLMRARGIVRREEGGGIGGESIIVHEVPLSGVDEFIDDFERGHGMVDLKVRLAVFLVKGSS